MSDSRRNLWLLLPVHLQKNYQTNYNEQTGNRYYGIEGFSRRLYEVGFAWSCRVVMNDNFTCISTSFDYFAFSGTPTVMGCAISQLLEPGPQSYHARQQTEYSRKKLFHRGLRSIRNTTLSCNEVSTVTRQRWVNNT